jgi:tripartite-type tricarboxylate transporter receptor subunit TctC
MIKAFLLRAAPYTAGGIDALHAYRSRVARNGRSHRRTSLVQSTYPTKSIRFVVPVTTGGPSDLVARLLGEKLSVSLGKQVIIDNRPGAS